MLEQLEAYLRPLTTSVANMVARGVINRVDDSVKLQLLQIGVLAGETLDGAERMQNYGFTSVPIKGAEVTVVFVGGDRAHPLIVATDDRRHRPTGELAGTVIMYNSDGAQIRLLGADVEVVPGAGGEVRIGSVTASDPVGLQSDLQEVYDAISGAAVVANDGGAAFKAAIITALDTAGFPVAATKINGV